MELTGNIEVSEERLTGPSVFTISSSSQSSSHDICLRQPGIIPRKIKINLLTFSCGLGGVEACSLEMLYSMTSVRVSCRH